MVAGGLVVKALDCRPTGPRFLSHYNGGVFTSESTQLCLKEVSRYILEGVSLEIYTTSFGRDVKPSGPGALVSVYCSVAISGCLISHPTSGFSYRDTNSSLGQ